jgi:hypothetical protein
MSWRSRNEARTKRRRRRWKPVASLRAREEDLRDAFDMVERERERVALEALKATRMLERFRELDLSDLKQRSAASVETSESEFDAANRRREKLRVAVEGIRAGRAAPRHGARTRRRVVERVTRERVQRGFFIYR